MTKYVKYTKEVLEEAVKVSFSYAGVVRALGMATTGGTCHYISRKVKAFGIDTSHFTGQGHNKGKISSNRLSADEILIDLPENSLRQKPHKLRRALKEKGIAESCNGCGLEGLWNNKPIQLEINHIDGSWLNNKLDNLEFLCPNCHSQDTNANKPHKHRTK